MNISEYLPVYDRLTESEKKTIDESVRPVSFDKGQIVYNSEKECLGPLFIVSGMLRACIYSDEGKEITVYRLLEGDMCLFAASCMMRSIQFNITIIADKPTEAYLIPAKVYKKLMENSAPLANYTNDIMGDRMTNVVWLIEQILWKSFDKRLAGFLLDEIALEESNTLKITHEKIAQHLGSAREVVTRMLKYFQAEGIVKLGRGTVEIIDEDSLYSMSD